MEGDLPSDETLWRTALENSIRFPVIEPVRRLGPASAHERVGLSLSQSSESVPPRPRPHENPLVLEYSGGCLEIAFTAQSGNEPHSERLFEDGVPNLDIERPQQHHQRLLS